MRAQPKHDLVYWVSTGGLWLRDEYDHRCLLARGYSGAHGFRDNPLFEREVGKGPVPRGVWKIGPSFNGRQGAIIFRLDAVDVPSMQGPNSSGRAGFLIHGDNSARDYSASRGCIILDRAARECIAALRVRSLLVE